MKKKVLKTLIALVLLIVVDWFLVSLIPDGEWKPLGSFLMGIIPGIVMGLYMFDVWGYD